MKEAAVFTTEAEFRSWFESNLARFGIKEIVLSQEVCPDYVAILDDGRTVKIEAELFAINFKYHQHDPAKADYIVACYSKTDEVEGVPVMAVHRLWCWDVEPSDPIAPEAPLAADEARLLSAIDQSGGIALSALSEGELGGDQQIWIRVPPDHIAAIPRSRIVDNLFNILTQPAKEWLRRYHHVLVGAGISEEGCRLLDSLMRRRLIEFRPIAIISSLFDGVMLDHPAWLPVEVRTTPNAREHHKHDIITYLHGHRTKD